MVYGTYNCSFHEIISHFPLGGHHLVRKIRELSDFTSSQMGDFWDVSMRNDTLPAEMVKMWDVYMRHDGKSRILSNDGILAKLV